jgi:hypothetical protein
MENDKDLVEQLHDEEDGIDKSQIDEDEFDTDAILEKDSEEESISNKKDMEFIYKLFAPSNKLDDVLKRISSLSEELGTDKFSKEWNTIGSFVNILAVLKNAYSDEGEFIRNAFEHVNPKTSGNKFESEDGNIKLANTIPSVKKVKKEVSGKKAKLLIMASKKSVKKVFLYSSGFYIVLRTPTLDELYILYNKLSEQTSYYGSQFGLMFYMFADFFIREIICEFIEELVVDSNLVNYSRNNNLFKAIVVHDYNSILLAIGSMIFNQGYPFVHVCLNCDSSEEEIVDLNLLQQTDYSKLSEEQVGILTKSKVTISDLTTYREFFGHTGKFKLDNFEFLTKVPTIYDFMKYGKIYHDNLVTMISDIDNQDAVNSYVAYSFNRIFAPWISELNVFDTDGEFSFSTKDQDGIISALNMLQSDSDHSNMLKEKMEKFMKMTIVTIIGYRPPSCPKCNEQPTDLVNGFASVDMQKLLFTILAMKLIQVS